MILYIAKRLGAGVVLALLVTFITFLLLSTSFRDVASTILGSSATPENVAGLMASKGWDRPVLVQYVDWLLHLLRGDLGISVYTSLPVGPSVLQRLAVTLSIIVPALILTAIIATALGVWAASRGGVVDKIAQGVSLVGYLVPGLLLAIGLVVVFAVQLKWLPATGFTPFTESPAGWARSIVIPVIVLMIGGIAGLAAQVRGRMIDELRRDYVRTLRTRGVPTRAIVLKHALRNAGSPALTVLSLEFIQMFGAALIIENVFALPGYGSYAFNASLQGDIPVVLGIAAFGVALVIVVNLVTDLANGWLNPKARVR
ncbi:MULTISPECIES: ABC transporter permease [unclassified Rathayibacter]|uniref:ABC transporter permease n=1 Tax=unclassified Rathayibacter TaxID=2609250 RepID=UPI00104487BC|nr:MULTISPECIES: ABC transporter permease [unclassified Rathayibacter]TCL82648.1 peptide/nickel transport system permease protein [Rathayibacter sp. PhB192]TCM27987.1 peptide/nickel transport system permease protein [Rathayibacter sp. PhB179]